MNKFISVINNVFIFGMNYELVHTGFQPMCHYIMALACGKKSDTRVKKYGEK